MRRLVVAMAVTLAIFSLPAKAWNRPGHMTTGAIAYLELTGSDPQALGKVIDLLKKHPDYKKKWLPRIKSLPSVGMKNHDLYLFMFAARWPDDIRGTPLHCEKCHYINYPYKPNGQPASVPEPEPDDDNIERAFKQKLDIVNSNSSSDSDKAMALCWVFHLVGDIHQPLHTAALFTTQFSEGDKGGTLFFIRAKLGEDTIHLHKFWDDTIIGTESFQSVRNRATALRAKPGLQRDVLSELSETDFDDWSEEESLKAAKEHAYRNGTLKGSTNSENGKVLPANYLKSIRPIAERRVVLAGYRLADILKDIF